MKKFSKLIGIILVIALCVSPAASAATNMPAASNYLAQYDAYIINNGGGSISIWFDVSGTGTMDQIGALTIILREYNGTSWNTGKNILVYRAPIFTYTCNKHLLLYG